MRNWPLQLKTTFSQKKMTFWVFKYGGYLSRARWTKAFFTKNFSNRFIFERDIQEKIGFFQTRCIGLLPYYSMAWYAAEFTFRGCRAAKEGHGHVFTLDKCQLTRQMIHIIRAYIGFTDDPSECHDYVRKCLKPTNHNEIMSCNGKRNCTFSQNVLNFPHDYPLCQNSTLGNYVFITYSCIDGKQNCHTPLFYKQNNAIAQLCIFHIIQPR